MTQNNNASNVVIGNVLSLFDGGSMGQQALVDADIKYGTYYASEVDAAAIKTAKKNFPNTVHLGDVNGVGTWELPTIDLLIGGSPCNDLSGQKRKEQHSTEEGAECGIYGTQSRLFFKYVDALRKFKPRYFLLENVRMNKESEAIITEALGVEPVLIDSNLFSAQDRPRLYWTNISLHELPKTCGIVTKDVLEPVQDVAERHWLNDVYDEFNGSKKVIGTLHKYYPKGTRKYYEATSRVYNPEYKMACLTAVAGGGHHKKVHQDGRPRRLTPVEYERMQGLPDGYTEGVAEGQRYKICGNGWTVPVITHIFKGIEGGEA